jgi:NodT family efflux transporter outer membrane factor (OMF) lipoprotein
MDGKAALMPKGKMPDAAKLAVTTTLQTATVDPSAWPMREWWQRFEDPTLDGLIAEALQGNPSLEAAAARLRKAQSTVMDAENAAGLQTSGSVSAVYQRLSEHYIIPPPYGGRWTWLSQGTVNASYTLDLWGGKRATVEAAVGKAKAAAVDTLAADLNLTTSVTRAYIELARASDQLDLATGTLEARSKVLDLVRKRVDAGIDSKVDLKQAEAAVPAARAQMAAWGERVAVACHQLAALTGKGPDAGASIPRPQPKAIPAKAILPTAISVDLIGRRPDVIADRLRVEASLRDVDAAEAAFYPNIDLTAFAGLQSIGLSNFVDSGSFVGGVGPAISLPFFKSGTLRSQLNARSADADAAIASYRQTLLSALRDIADELAGADSVATQLANETEAVAVLQQAYDLAVLRYKEGVGTYLQVLTAETQLLAQKGLAADLRAREFDVAVSLIQSLGGGVDTLPDGTQLHALMPHAAVRVSSREPQP